MANVQLENGYTRLANEILNEIIKLPLSGTQFRIVLFVWRNSYGFQKKDCEFSESYIAKAIGASKRFISSELVKLINMRLIKV
ncbi:MAG TPA: replication protein, partial [Clostridia bacterium]